MRYGKYLAAAMFCVLVSGGTASAADVDRTAPRNPDWVNALKPKGTPGPELTLATNHTTTYAILESSQPTTQDDKAALDLAQYLQQMTGATFPIVKEGALGAVQGPFLSVGRTHLLEHAKLTAARLDLGKEGYAIAAQGQNLFLIGGSLRGPINAVYALLEEDLGCRWYARETASIPQVDELKFRPMLRSYVPVLELRDPYYWDAFDTNWSLRNRTSAIQASIPLEWGGNASWPPGWFAHSFSMLVPTDQYFATHPEYFSEIGGKRVPGQLCLSNPDVVQIAIAKVREVLKANPGVRFISVAQNDGAPLCECPLCSAVTEEQGSKSGPLLNFVNQIADAIAPDFPDVKITTLAYLDTFMPPKNIKPRPNVVIHLATDSHAWEQPFLTVDETQKFQTALKAWNALGAHIFIWDYTVNYSHFLAPMPDMPVVTPDMRFYIAHGVTGIMLEGAYINPGGSDAALKSWVWAQQMWDPSLDTQALIRDFNYGYYGAAAPPMQQYQDLEWDTWVQNHHGSMTSPDGGIRYSPTSPWLTGDFLTQATALFQQAEQLATDPETSRRVAVAKLAILYVRLCAGPTGPEDVPAYLQARDEFKGIADRENITTISEGPADVANDLVRWSMMAGRAKIKLDVPGTLFADGTDFTLAMWLGAQAPSLVEDPLAESGYAVRQPGDNTQWSIQWHFPLDKLVPGKTYQLRVRLRADKKGDDGPAFGGGVWDSSKSGGPGQSFMAKDVTTDYQWYTLATFVPGPNQIIYLAPANNAANIPAIYTERIELVPVDAAQ